MWKPSERAVGIYSTHSPRYRKPPLCALISIQPLLFEPRCLSLCQCAVSRLRLFSKGLFLFLSPRLSLFPLPLSSLHRLWSNSSSLGSLPPTLSLSFRGHPVQPNLHTCHILARFTTTSLKHKVLGKAVKANSKPTNTKQQKSKHPPKPPKQAKWGTENSAQLIQVLTEQQEGGNQADDTWKGCVWLGPTVERMLRRRDKTIRI